MLAHTKHTLMFNRLWRSRVLLTVFHVDLHRKWLYHDLSFFFSPWIIIQDLHCSNITSSFLGTSIHHFSSIVNIILGWLVWNQNSSWSLIKEWSFFSDRNILDKIRLLVVYNLVFLSFIISWDTNTIQMQLNCWVRENTVKPIFWGNVKILWMVCHWTRNFSLIRFMTSVTKLQLPSSRPDLDRKFQLSGAKCLFCLCCILWIHVQRYSEVLHFS